jgi:hypothetical protein
MMGIEELKGNLLEAIRTSDDEDLLLDLKSRVDIDYYLKDKGVASILGGVDIEELISLANEPDTPYNSINEQDFMKWLKEWKSS